MTSALGGDTFANGGQLVNLSSWYAGRDKTQHVVCGFAAAHACRRVGLSRRATLVVVLVGAIAVEVIEQIRFWKWRAAVTRWYRQRDRTAPIEDSPPRPNFSDTFSWRDIVAGMVGAVLGAL